MCTEPLTPLTWQIMGPYYIYYQLLRATYLGYNVSTNIASDNKNDTHRVRSVVTILSYAKMKFLTLFYGIPPFCCLFAAFSCQNVCLSPFPMKSLSFQANFPAKTCFPAKIYVLVGKLAWKLWLLAGKRDKKHFDRKILGCDWLKGSKESHDNNKQFEGNIIFNLPQIEGGYDNYFTQTQWENYIAAP